MTALGYQRADTVAEHGEYAVRGVADRPLPRRRGAGAAARLLRRRDGFDPPLRSRRPALDRQGQGLHLDARVGSACSTRRRSSASARAIASSSAPTRPRTRSTRRCPTAAAWPGWNIGCRCSRSGFRPCSIISASDDLILRDGAADKALEARREAIEDYYQNRTRAMASEPGSYRPLEPDALYLSRRNGTAFVADRPIHLASPFPEAESRPDHRLRGRIGARLRPRTRAASQRLRSGRGRMSPGSAEAAARSCSPATPKARASASPACSRITGSRPTRWSRAGRRRSAARPSRRCSCSRSITASPPPTSPCSPSRTCSATASSAVAGSARPPQPSSKSLPRSPPATSWSTPITASAATKA